MLNIRYIQVKLLKTGWEAFKLIKSFCGCFTASRGPHGMGNLLELALLSSEFYPRPYALGPRLKLFKRAPLAEARENEYRK